MNIFRKQILPALIASASIFTHANQPADTDDTLIIEDEPGTLLLIEDTQKEEVLIIGSEGEALLLDESSDDSIPLEQLADHSQTNSALSIQLQDLWLEYSHFSNSDATADNTSYFHSEVNLDWNDGDHWEIKASARVDGYTEPGNSSSDELDLDYGDTYFRYKTGQSSLTLGAQTVIWGRIDEFPPTDRLSTQDLRRFIIDDLEDRRLASLAFRFEHFLDNGKIDLVIYPEFREAELGDKASVWYPVNQETGEILGLKTNVVLENIIKNALINEDAPDSEGGAGIRYSSLGSDIDLGVTFQHGRQTIPYFSYNANNNTLEIKYPRTSIVAGDIGFEALGGTLKLEAAWLSDVPVTQKNGRYTEVASISWGAAWEVFPGDGDARLNLQITSQNLLDAPAVFERENIYAFNGTVEMPFADHNWRAKARFNLGLDEKDMYLNPEVAYTGWRAQEAYLELHLFDGDKGTPGGFHQDNSSISVGWRGSF